MLHNLCGKHQDYKGAILYQTSESLHEYRFKDHGPKDLTNGTTNVDLGVVVITPGECHPCHRHEHQEESFLGLEGECTVWVNGELVVLKAGDYLSCEKGDSHYFENVTKTDFKAVFIKAPRLDFKDSVYLDWRPGEVYDPLKVINK
jgi:quercetin dioxygenase-like cupin family protein